MKEEMVRILIIRTEVTSRGSQPVPPDQVILGEDSIILKKPHEYFNSMRDFGLPDMKKRLAMVT